MPHSDERATRLFQDATRGDARAAVALLEDYLPRLRAFVRSRLGPELRARESYSDVVQSVCRELIEHQDGFRFEGETRFRGWLFTAALNKVREKFRYHHQPKRDPRREVVGDTAAGEALIDDRAARPSYVALANERAEILEAALDRLSEGDREVIALCRLAGLPVEQAAERLGKNVAATRKQLSRAIARLGAELGRLRLEGTES